MQYAVPRILLGYDVYLGKENDDRTTLEVVDQLLDKADLLIDRHGQHICGRELFTNKYYMSVALAEHLF